MTATPAVSVVVPTYDRCTYLERLLPSLRTVASSGQVEVVIVDDGSTDGTAALLQDLPWATTVAQPNAGAAAARNTGWRRAAAPVVAFIDDDCTPGPGWPLGLLAPFDDETVVGVGGQVTGAGAASLDVYVEVERLVDHGRSLDDGDVDYLVTANAAFRVAALEAVGGFDEEFPGAAGEDVDLSWRLRERGGRLVRAAAEVRHQHRSTVGEILRTYRTHGRARARLDQSHPHRGAAPAAGRALAPGTWIEHGRTYRRRGVALPAVAGLLVLRAGGMGAFALGLSRGRRELRSG